MSINKIEKEIVEKILRDLTDRRGLKHAWEDIDSDIQEEIKQELERIVGEVLKEK